MATPERAMGFLADKCLEQALRRQFREEEIFLLFDSGRCITFADAVHHLLALGSTGSGKTQTVIFPALLRLMRAGAFGLSIDIKGNMRNNVRALARICGREQDIVEYGTAPAAEPLNLLAGMERHQIRAFFEQLTLQNFQGASQSIDWHMKGVAVATDCAQLILFLSEKYPDFVLGCRLVHEMVTEPEEAVKLFEFFKKNVYDPARADHKQLVSTVENNRFHVLRKIKVSGSSENTRDEQMTWALQGVRDGLRAFLDAPGIERNFCRPGAPGLELAKPMLEGKIVILRFDLDTGPVGAKLARTMLSHFYSRVFQLGLTLPKDKKSFVCIDEFQEVADLSKGRYSDSSFIAMAREFNCIFMAATQSMSSLLATGEDASAVLSFASNCNQKIIYYSDDPMTRELAARFDPDVNLSDLNSGEAFVATYEHDIRRHAHGIETLNQSYASVREILASVNPEPILEREDDGFPSCSLGALVELAQKGGSQNKSEAKSQKEIQAEKNLKESKEASKMQANVKALIEKFPDLFTITENSEFCLPTGWIAYVEKAISAFQASGISANITDIRIDNGLLHALNSAGHDKSSAGVSLFNSFLFGVHRLCVICGKPLSNKESEQSRGRIGTCNRCLEKFGLAISDDETSGDDDDDFLNGTSADFDAWP